MVSQEAFCEIEKLVKHQLLLKNELINPKLQIKILQIHSHFQYKTEQEKR